MVIPLSVETVRLYIKIDLLHFSENPCGSGEFLRKSMDARNNFIRFFQIA